MHYIHRFLTPGAKVLEVGAGTGRYSIALAGEGTDVSSIRDDMRFTRVYPDQQYVDQVWYIESTYRDVEIPLL